MKKRLYIMFAVLAAMMVILTSCSIDNGSSDRTVMISFGNSGARELTSSNQIPLSNDLYWFYTAEKKDGGYSTGTKSTQAPVDDTHAAGYADKQVGPFSYGVWEFRLYGYASLNSDNTGKDLIYSGINSNVTLSAESTTVPVTVSYQNQTGQSGYLQIDDVTFLTESASGTIDSATVTIIRDSDSSIVRNNVSLTRSSSGKYSLPSQTLTDGVYRLNFRLLDNAGNEVGTVNSRYVLILSGRITRVSGTILENTANGSFVITIIEPADDVYEVSGGKRFVSRESQLRKALSDSVSGTNTIILNNNISVSTDLSVTGNVVIDLNGNSLTYSGNGKLFTLGSGASLELRNGSITGPGTGATAVFVPAGGTVNLSGMTSDGTFSKVIQSDNYQSDSTSKGTAITLSNSVFAGGSAVLYSEATKSLSVSGCSFTGVTAPIELKQFINGTSVTIGSSEFLNCGAMKIHLGTAGIDGFTSVNITGCTYAGTGNKFVILGSQDNDASISDALASGFSMTGISYLLDASAQNVFEDGTGSSSPYIYNPATGSITKGN